jgi:hypothetical protein
MKMSEFPLKGIIEISNGKFFNLEKITNFEIDFFPNQKYQIVLTLNEKEYKFPWDGKNPIEEYNFLTVLRHLTHDTKGESKKNLLKSILRLSHPTIDQYGREGDKLFLNEEKTKFIDLKRGFNMYCGEKKIWLIIYKTLDELGTFEENYDNEFEDVFEFFNEYFEMRE